MMFESLFSQVEKFSFPYWNALLFYDRTEIHQDSKVYLVKIAAIHSQLMSAFIDEKNRDKNGCEMAEPCFLFPCTSSRFLKKNCLDNIFLKS